MLKWFRNLFHKHQLKVANYKFEIEDGKKVFYKRLACTKCDYYIHEKTEM